MPAMKLTPNAAMRARDVSRPRAEHLAEAEAAEASAAAGSRARTGEAVNQARGEAQDEDAAAAAAAGHGRRAGGTAQVPATPTGPRVALRSLLPRDGRLRSGVPAHPPPGGVRTLG